MTQAARWIAAVVLANGLSWAYGQQTGDQLALQQKLNSLFSITVLAANHSDIATPGDVVELHKDGMRLSALSAVLTESNTYKDGKIGGGAGKRAWGSFGTAMLQATVAAMDTSGSLAVPDGTPPRILAAGDKCWIIAITVQKDSAVFKLFTDPDDSGMRYRGDLKIPFPSKKQVPAADVFLPMIAEVMSVVQQDQDAQPAQESVAAPAAGQVQDSQQAIVSGKYLLEKAGAELDIVSDTGCTILLPGGKLSSGVYRVNGDILTISCSASGEPINFKIQGANLVAANGQIWAQEGSAPPRQYDDVAPPPPPPAPTPTVTIGELKAQVTADFGEPQRKAASGAKEIYFYSDLKMKVTFVNGKVTSID